jgi:hypothetical protein
MKRIWFFFLLALVPAVLQAQSLGQVKCYSLFFSTGIPEDAEMRWNPETGDFIKMPQEHREAALKSIERTFGKIESYEETYNECQGRHVVVVTLDSGDTIDFEEGRLSTYTIVSPRYLIAGDMFDGGLRVGQKPNTKCKEGVIFEQWKNDPSHYVFYWEGTDYSFGHCILDEEGLIKEIYLWHNDC